MKKVLSLVCLLAIVATCLFAFASCGATPNADPEAAEKALKDAGYTVVDGSFGAIVLVGADNAKNIEKAITATKSAEDYVNIYYFKDAESANAAYEALEEWIEAAEEAADASAEEDYGVSDKMVWIGTSEAIEAAQ